MATRRLTRLTAAQADMLPAIRDDWLAIGLSTAPADRMAAESAVQSAYRAAGLEPPRLVLWLDSPMAGAIGAAILAQVGAQVRAQVWDQVRDQVRAQVRAQVEDQVWDQVEDQVAAQVWAQVAAQVGAQVRAQVRDQVAAQVWAQVGAQVRAQVWDQVEDQVSRAAYGAHDASWLGFYHAFARCGLAAMIAPLTGLLDLARSAGWWWPFRGAVILTERPTHLCRDEEHRLHSETGPALRYPDGWGIYAWHGIRVPAAVIEQPETITAETITTERNAEVRRAMIERIGWERYLTMSQATQVQADDYGALLELPGLPDDDEPLRLVRVTNSTPEPDGQYKDYILRVPPTVTSAREAVAWTFGVERPEDYAPAVQT